MSALGQKQIFSPPSADMCGAFGMSALGQKRTLKRSALTKEKPRDKCPGIFFHSIRYSHSLLNSKADRDSPRAEVNHAVRFERRGMGTSRATIAEEPQERARR